MNKEIKIILSISIGLGLVAVLISHLYFKNIKKSLLAKVNQGLSASPTLKISPNQRVVFISLPEIPPYLKAGDEIDLLFTAFEGNLAQEIKTILEKIKVFEIYEKADSSQTGISLILSPQETETLYLAKENGKLSISLRRD